MATYPIKMLKDENNNPFVPLVSTECVKDSGGQSLDQKLATKLETSNILAGDNTISVSTSGNNVSITANLPAGSTLIDNLTTTTAGQGALDAHQGKILKDLIPTIIDDLTSTDATKALSAKQGYTLNQKFNDYTLTSALEGLIKQYILASHPIGSIEINISGANPSTYLGGTWVAWGTGKVPVGVNTNDTDFNTVEKTGGSKTISYKPAGTNSGTAVTLNAVTLSHSGGAVGSHTLTVAEIPSHKHTIYQDARGDGSRYGVVTSYGATGGSQIAMLNGSGGTSNLFPDAGDNAKGLVNADYTGGSGGHNHTFTQPSQHSFTPTTKTITQPTFTGTTTTLNIQQEYITCYMWKRTA